MYIDRTISKTVQEAHKSFPAIFLTGPRQSGKTTLLRHLYKTYEYISLEDFDVRAYANEDPRGFINDYPKHVIIDEAQRAPKLFSYLQTHIDNSNINGQYIFTGSQNFTLIKNMSQSLAGRVAILELLPLSQQELAGANLLTDNLNEWILKGAYPRLITHKIKPSLYYRSYINTYLERDVKDLVSINNVDVFGKFLKVCASRAGAVVNYSDISNELGVDYRTIRSWLSILKANYIIFELQPYHNNFGKRITKNPKLYFYDTGVLCNLLEITSKKELNNSPLKGHVFENAIVSEYQKRYIHSGDAKPYFFRSGETFEIDLLLEKSTKLKALEIKSSQTASKKFVQNLHRIVDFSDTKLDDTGVVFAGEQSVKLEGVRFYPWDSIYCGSFA